MGSTFYGFEIAKTGLFYNQKALDVTAHNIANADTQGYSRQRIVGKSIDPASASSLLAELNSSSVGAGVSIDSIERIKSQFLERQYRNENSLQGEWNIKSDVLSYVENLFNEPSDTGISNSINEFFKGISELSRNAGSKDIRTNLLQQAINLTETVQHYNRQLVQIQEEQDYALSTSVEKINDLITNIAALNDRINKYELGGETANDLRDKRDLFIDELSGYAGISYKENKVNGQSVLTLNVKVYDNAGSPSEITIVDNDKYNLFMTHKDTLPGGGTDPFNSVYIESGAGTAVNVDGKMAVKVTGFTMGSLKGYMDMRDGDDKNSKGTQYFINQLDKLAESLVTGFNTIHSQGFTYPDPGSGLDSVSGVNFFDPTCTKASDIKVSDAIYNNVFNIAASSKKIEGVMNSGNNENLLNMLKLRDSRSIGGIYNFEDFMRSYVTELGVSTSYANNMTTNQETLLRSIDNRRQSVSSVSLDEEMANMVKYEKSYQASARMITAMDEMLDVLVNKTGLAGR